MLPGLSAYASSKLAQVKLLEFLAAENPNIFVASLHPGIVETKTFTKSGSKADALPMDKGESYVPPPLSTTLAAFLIVTEPDMTLPNIVQLPAHFTVWLTSPEAAFLKGRLVWANWDVNELKARAEEIASGVQLTTSSLSIA